MTPDQIIDRIADLVLEAEREVHHGAMVLIIAARMVRERHAKCMPPLPEDMVVTAMAAVAVECVERLDTNAKRQAETESWIRDAESNRWK